MSEPRGRGRPRKAPDELKSGRLEIRLSEAERAEWSAMALIDEADSLADWLRGLAERRGNAIRRRHPELTKKSQRPMTMTSDELQRALAEHLRAAIERAEGSDLDRLALSVHHLFVRGEGSTDAAYRAVALEVLTQTRWCEGPINPAAPRPEWIEDFDVCGATARYQRSDASGAARWLCAPHFVAAKRGA
jgi:hypothetical protein